MDRKTSRWLMLLAAGVVAATTSVGSAAPKVPGNVVATPGSSITGYGTPRVVITKGSNVTLRNIDLAPHDVVSNVPGLFKSALIGIGKSAPVSGTSLLAPGTYGFHCTLHSKMKGQLTVR